MTPLRAERLSDQVAGELEDQILRGLLAPGDRLPSEAELATMLGVSRTVVRDAVRTLTARGLINVRHGHGMEVAQPSDLVFGEALVLLLARSNLRMRDVFAARAAIEVGLGPLAAVRGTGADWETLEQHLDRFAQTLSKREWGAAEEAHRHFHLQILTALRLPALDALLQPMQEIILLTLPPSPEEEESWDLAAHYPILKALQAHDERATRAALEAHFRFIEDDERYRDLQDRPFRDPETLAVIRDLRARSFGRDIPVFGSSGHSDLLRVDAAD